MIVIISSAVSLASVVKIVLLFQENRSPFMDKLMCINYVLQYFELMFIVGSSRMSRIDCCARSKNSSPIFELPENKFNCMTLSDAMIEDCLHSR